MNLKFRTTTVIAGFSFLLCATARADESVPPAGSTLDAARKDLKTLPATEKSQELLGKATGLGSASLPALTIPGGSGDAPPNKPDPNAPPSDTWLQDALNQTDAEHGQRRSGSGPAREREKISGGTTSASDPLAPYLGQWLTPRDQELLRPDARKTTDSAGPLKIPGDSSLPTASGTDRSGTQTLQTDFLPVSPLEPAKNPYLPEPPPQVQAPSPFAPSTPAKALPGSIPPGQTGQSKQVKPAARPVETPVTSPNAPTVDDRKYFPQLRRF